jgi:light-regulated signal transduction histidine kinase (bacteriophytochrome)
VSHDLRAPIRHIAGFTDMLSRHNADQLDDRGKHYVRTIAGAARQAGTLIDDLLGFARCGRSELVRRPIELDELVASCRRELSQEAASAARAIEWRIDKLPRVVGDPAMLKIVVRNLLSNAMKYTRRQPHPVISIGHRIEGDEHVVTVRDNGVDFDMKHASKLFGVFQRLHRSDEFEGTGIGLATVRRIVGRHGGRTTAEGRLDEGAVFTFSLPILVPELDALKTDKT